MIKNSHEIDSLSGKKRKKYALDLPDKVEYIVIDVSPKRNPVIPPKEMTSFHVVSFEPSIDLASQLKNISERMHVLPCTLGAKNGIKRVKYGGFPSSRSFQAIVMPFKKIIESIPENSELFIRLDANNFSLEDATESKNSLQHASLIKKEIQCSAAEIEPTKEKWLELMDSLGFNLVKLDTISSVKKELVWINTKIIKNGKPFETFLIKNLSQEQQPIRSKLFMVRNFVKLAFNTLFFGSDKINVYRSNNNPLVLPDSEGSWRLVPPMTKEFPLDAYEVDSCAKSQESSSKTNAKKHESPQKTGTSGEKPPELPPSKTFIVTHSFFKGGLHCGHADKKRPGEAFFCWSKYQLITGDYQVLCGKNFSWKAQSSLKIPDGAVVGGRDNTGDPLFPTRVVKDGKVFIGKVCATWVISEGAEKRLKCQYYDEVTMFAGDFDVLVYTGTEI